MALLTVQQVGTPSTPTYVAVAASDTVVADSAGLVLHVKNAGGSSDTVTLTDPGTTPAGSAATNPTFAVPATTGDRMYLLPSSLANASGIITIAHSFTTSVTCAVFRVG
jgi:hypothetical protein